MATNIGPLEFEDNGASIEIVLTHQTTGSSYPATITATRLDFQDQGVVIDEDQGGSPPVTVRHFVPWSQIHRIHQEVIA